MSVKVLTWVWHNERTEGLRGNEMLVMLSLADVADDDGNLAYLREDSRSQASLSAKARVSVATFRRATQSLEEQGLLEITRVSQRSENEYRILLTAQAERSPVSGQSAHGERSERSPVSGHSPYRRTNVEGRGRARGARIPEPFIVTSEMRVWAAQEVPSVDVDRATRAFVDYWRAESGAKASKRDWVAAWRFWLRKDHQRVAGSRPSGVRSGLSLVESMRERERAEQGAIGA